MIEVLTPIWQRVLRLPAITPEDHFFDLGGDSSLALELFNEIAKTSGRHLPPATIYQAPTIAALSRLLEKPNPTPFPAVVLLKLGTQGPPIFMTHGLGGSVIDFYQLIKHIECENPIYGMQSRGIDGVEQPFERVEDMAQFYLDAITELQPHGPYFLIGFSLGGLVAFEMAQQLRKTGEQIALLEILDAYPHNRYVRLGERARLAARQTKRRASNLLRPKIAARSPSEQAPGSPLDSAMDRVRDSAYRALESYKPGFYPGKINFIRAEVVTDFPRDAVSVWKPLAQELEVETVPGDHLGILTTHFKELGLVLSRHIKEVI
ncbi:MAG: hypothetical protein JOY93_05165 [Acidobacteriales bacterium]|nr:hypothetical protein [Terriglobales bacterium]